MLCDYGCEQEGIYYFKPSNKYCCSSHYRKCPVERKRTEKEEEES